jgi:hypothetical protein
VPLIVARYAPYSVPIYKRKQDFRLENLIGFSQRKAMQFQVAGFSGWGKGSFFCNSERSEESLFDLTVRKQRKRDSSLRSE